MNGAARLAVSWLTVLPIRGPESVDRTTAARAIALAPMVGILLGAPATGLLWVLHWVGASSSLSGLLTVGMLALATRGMHLDGLADSADGLGCYGPPERAREIMKSGGVGPFGVVALVFAIGVQALGFAELAAQQRWYAVGFAIALSRVAVVVACRHGYSAAPGSGFGTLVAGTQSRSTVVGWTAIGLVAALVAGGSWWWGPVAAAAALLGAGMLVRHCVRRFGGLNGDVLGAAIEMTVAAAVALLTLPR